MSTNFSLSWLRMYPEKDQVRLWNRKVLFFFLSPNPVIYHL